MTSKVRSVREPDVGQRSGMSPENASAVADDLSVLQAAAVRLELKVNAGWEEDFVFAVDPVRPDAIRVVAGRPEQKSDARHRHSGPQMVANEVIDHPAAPRLLAVPLGPCG
jgi:hypothetical protein